jgi:uncharacterized membrane protein YgcG
MMQQCLRQLLVLTLLALALPGWMQERVHTFHADLTLTSDAVLHVRETITLRATGEKIQHGIYREFATQYRDRRGQWVVLTLEGVTAQRDGAPEPVRTVGVMNGTRCYLGRPDVLLPPGRYTYTLGYTVTGAVATTERGQALYWNATGYSWRLPIDAASVTLTLPNAASPVTLSAYLGRRGTNTEHYTAQRDADGHARYIAYDPLEPGEAFIVMADFPTVLTRPTVQRALDPALKYGGMGLLVVLGYYLLAWWLFGRAPAMRPHVTPRFTPPGGLPPAALRYLWRMGYDTKILAVSLIELALHGVLTIVHYGKDFRLESEHVFYWDPERHLLQELASGIPVHTRTLARRLGEPVAMVHALVGALITSGVPLKVDRDVVHLRRGEPSMVPIPAGSLPTDAWRLAYDLLGPARGLRLDDTAYAIVKPAIANQRRYLEASYERRYFNANRWFMLPGVLLSCVVVGYAAFGDFSGIAPTVTVVAGPHAPPPVWIQPVFNALQPVLHALVSALVAFLTEALVCKRSAKHYIVLAALIFFPVALLVVLHVKGGAFNHFPATFLLVTFLIWGVSLLFAHLIKAPTSLGQGLFTEIDAFRAYLLHPGRAAHIQGAPAEDAATFERLLPYAMALDAEGAWIAHFGPILANRPVEQPYLQQWLVGDGLGRFDAAALATALNDEFANAISLAAVRRDEGSSGSGHNTPGGRGGGGGGGGTGGGGGW